MNDNKFIARFQEIKLSKICNELNYNISNILNGTASGDKRHIVRSVIEKKIKELLEDSNNGNGN